MRRHDGTGPLDLFRRCRERQDAATAQHKQRKGHHKDPCRVFLGRLLVQLLLESVRFRRKGASQSGHDHGCGKEE